MAKQKVVVKVSMNSDKKSRSKALQIAVSISGIESAAFVGSDKDQIAVTGEGIDSIELTTLLRKKVGHTELISVGPVETTKKKEESPKLQQVVTDSYSNYPYYYNRSGYGVPYYNYNY